jgi:tetraacyldisaccharide-1-P 4'-kinase
MFRRFEVPDRNEPLVRAGLAGDEPLLLVERDGERLALLVSELAYHHVAQGELAGLPFLATF